MNPRVTEAEIFDYYRVLVSFDNGEKKIFDITPFLNYPVYQALKDHALFNRVYCCFGTLVWPSGIDFCPDTIYLESQKLN